ncbi:cell division ATP-binding membraine protein FtsE [Escherichia coli]|uniref:Cell division ATP-binding membraine protein FtsE n=1 Tax=Escherichia coli TaxID=562 RepID=A0A377K0I2_ECOLX|nr:cell division ATP-binding membraine protein FtsE [Escherichia coli]
MIRFEHVSKAYLGGRQALQGRYVSICSRVRWRF